MAGGVRTVARPTSTSPIGIAWRSRTPPPPRWAFANGAVGTIEATCASHVDWEPSMQFHGTEGAIELRHDRP